MGGIFNNVDKNFNRSTLLPTVLQVSKDELDYWTNMTCFYDKYWTFDPKFSTVPISFMHITSVTESIAADGPAKRVIVYEAPETVQKEFSFNGEITQHPAYKNNIEVIMDNVVVQPKQYQMEVIIPDSLIGPYQKQGFSRLTALLDYMSLTDENSYTDKIADGIRTTQVYVDAIQQTADVLDTLLGVAGGSAQMATINKNSLEAMASKGRVVLFKKWTGYDYSFGLITKVDIAKKPSETGVYRGSITFQETPILNISKKKSDSGFLDASAGAVLSATTQIARITSLALSYPFIQLTGVMEEAGAPGSDTPDGGGAFDIFTEGF